MNRRGQAKNGRGRRQRGKGKEGENEEKGKKIKEKRGKGGRKGRAGSRSPNVANGSTPLMINNTKRHKTTYIPKKYNKLNF